MLSLTGRLPVRIELEPDGSFPAAAPAQSTSVAPCLPEDICNGLSRAQIVDRILTINPSATTDFLDQFDVQALSAYLDHLAASLAPRGRSARWIRPAGSCGISWSIRRA